MNWVSCEHKLPDIPYCKQDGTRLISGWVKVLTEDGNEVTAYYHALLGWMVRGEPVGTYKYGYVPLNSKVTHWKVL